MKLIKKYKFTTFVVILFIIMVFGCYYIYQMFTTNTGKSVCGGRSGYVEITPEEYNKLQSNIVDGSDVLSLNTNISCEVFSVSITVNDNMTKDKAKKIGESIIKELTNEQLSYYDIQVSIKKNNASLNDFPIMGYKQNALNKFSWTKDREVTIDEAK